MFLTCSELPRVDNTLAPPVSSIAHFSSEVCEKWHTISNLGNLCAKNFSFYFGGRGGVAHDSRFGQFVCQYFLIFILGIEEEWHTIFNLGDLCAKVDRDRLERQRPPGTQNPDLAICVPKLTIT